jgi:hypothetical protein
MSLRPSRASELSRLIGDLQDADAIRRETAAARLAVIGERAVGLLLQVADGRAGARAAARAAALGALAAIGDSRAVALAVRLADDAADDVALAAIDVLGAVVHGSGPEATQAFDRLAELALSRSRDPEQRVAAVAALEGLPEKTLRPIYQTLAADDSSQSVARVARAQAGDMLSLSELVERLPDDPAILLTAVRHDGASARLTTLKRAIDLIRAREAGVAQDVRGAWMIVRGQLHQETASRGSRIALYDLRETIEAARGPLPVGFIAAVTAIGDASCLDALAAAWAASASDDERWWRDHLADAFRAIVTREKLTRRAPALRRVLERRPAAGALVALAKR